MPDSNLPAPTSRSTAHSPSNAVSEKKLGDAPVNISQQTAKNTSKESTKSSSENLAKNTVKLTGLLKSSVIFSLMTLLSRILGLWRDMLIAQHFNTLQTDAFFIALRIPNTLRRFFAEGSFSSAFVPVLGETKRERPQELAKVINATLGILTAVLLLVTGIGWLLADEIVSVAKHVPEKAALAKSMLYVTFPYIIFISLSALLAGVLNLHNRFALPALVPALLNLTLIGFIVFLRPHFSEPSMSLAWAVLLAGVLQFVVQIPAIYRLGIALKPSFNWRLPAVRKIFKLMLPTLIGASAGQINILINTLLAASLTTGSVTWLYYAERLIEFPIALIGVALGVVILPRLSQLKPSDPLHQKTLTQALQFALLIGSAAALGLVCLAYPLICTLFVRGKFSVQDAQMASHALQILGAGAFFLVMNKVLTPAFYAMQNTRTPMKLALISVVSNIILSLLLYRQLGYLGLAIASTAAAGINMVLLLVNLVRQGLLPLNWRKFSVFLLQVGLANLILFGALAWGRGLLGEAWQNWQQLVALRQVVYLIIFILGSMAIYAASLLVLGVPLLKWLHPPRKNVAPIAHQSTGSKNRLDNNAKNGD